MKHLKIAITGNGGRAAEQEQTVADLRAQLQRPSLEPQRKHQNGVGGLAIDVAERVAVDNTSEKTLTQSSL